MAEFTPFKNLYKWKSTDTKRTTINEMYNNAQKIEDTLVSVDAQLAERVLYAQTKEDLRHFKANIGDYIVTAGYYLIGDGGGAKYQIVAANTGVDDGGSFITLLNGLQAKLCLESNINVRQFGAKGNGVTDDTLAIQAIIDYAYLNKLAVYFPTGTYIITRPLYLWGSVGYETMGVKLFSHSNASVTIKKTTHNASGDGSALDSLDAVIIIARYDKNATIDCYRAEIENICIDGLIASSDYVKYGVTFKNRCAEIRLTNCTIKADICFQNQGSMWQSSFRELMMYPLTKGFSMIASGTSNLLERCYVWGSSVKAYELRGDYSFGNNLAVDNATGICYDFYYADWTINGMGEESANATKFISTSRATLNVSSITSLGVLGDNCIVFDIGSNSNVKIDSGNIGSLDIPRTINGKFLEKTATKSFFTLGNNVFVHNTYSQNTATDGNSSGSIISSNYSTPIRYRGKGHSPHIGIDRADNISFVDKYNTTPKLFGKAIFLDCEGYPVYDSFGVDRSYNQKANKGDVFLENTPTSNGAFAWVQTNTGGTYLREGSFAKVPIILSGTTAERPTLRLVVGQQYFDTTLGKPIWCKNASTPVWVDANGTTV